MPAAFAERAVSLIPNADMVTLDSGHFIPLDRPVEVATKLSDFFAKNETAVGPTSPIQRPLKRLTPQERIIPGPLGHEAHPSLIAVS